MTCYKLLFLTLCILLVKLPRFLTQPVDESYRGYVENEDNIIDNLLTRRDSSFPPSVHDDMVSLENTLQKGEVMNFGVNHSDPRYFMSSEALRTGMKIPNGSAPVHSEYKEEQGSNWLGRGSSKGGAQTPSVPAEMGQVSYLKEGRQEAQMRVPFVHGERAKEDGMSDVFSIVVMAGCTAAAVCAIIAVGFCYFKFNRKKKDAADFDYPAYGVTGPSKEFSPSAADRKLAQSAHMFHYQHQKQQMIALGNGATKEDRVASVSDAESEEGDEEGHYTVYECPGLAPTGEMEVKNPLFSDDPTPVTPPTVVRAGHRAGSNGVNSSKNETEESDE